MIIGERWTLSSKNGDLTWFQSQNGHIMVIFIEIYPPVPSNHGKNSEVSMRSCWESHIELHGSVDFTIKNMKNLPFVDDFLERNMGVMAFPCHVLPLPGFLGVPWVPRLPFSPMLKECSCGHAAGPVCCLLWLLRNMIEATKDESKPPLSNTP